MSKYDSLSDLAAVTIAKADIERMAISTPGRESALAACDLFMSEAVKQVAGHPSMLNPLMEDNQ